MSRYLTVEQLRSIASLGDLPVDVEAQTALDAAEEAIEDFCGRRFYLDAADQARYYTADTAYRVWVDDLVELTSVKTDEDGDGAYEVTWATAERVLAPYNAASDDRPYTCIEVNGTASLTFPAISRGVEVTGKFGWPTIPSRVVQATTIQATRLLKRARSAPFGIEAVTVDGQPIRIRAKLDPDVEVMLTDLRRAGRPKVA